MSHGIADGQLMTALGAATGKHRSTIFVGHAGAEPMLVDSFPIARLIGSLHWQDSDFLKEVFNLALIPLIYQGIRGKIARKR